MSNQTAMVDPTVLARVQHHLQGLKKTADGSLLYGLIERGLNRYGSHGQIERAFIDFVNGLLRKYAQDPNADPVTRFKARVIQQRLMLQFAPAYAPATDERTAGAADGAETTPESLYAKQPSPLPAAPMQAAVATRAETAPSLSREMAGAKTGATKTVLTDVAAVPVARPTATEPAASVSAEDTSASATAVGPALATLRRGLAADVVGSLAHDRDLGRLLEQNRGLLKRIGEPGLSGGDLKDIESLLLTGIEQLIDGHQQLGANLQRASEYLKLIQTDRQQLQRQLHRARSESLIDDLTGLPNRAALVRSLTAEIGRARRYGTPLTVALIDIDGFAQIDADLGRDASEQVLLAYSDRLLSQFRAYDIVSRYGYDAFAILFPNTDAAGAQRALEKLRAQAATTRIALGGKTQTLPSFCAVVAPYLGNEKPAALLRRADQSLAQRLAQGRTPPIHILLSA